MASTHGACVRDVGQASFAPRRGGPCLHPGVGIVALQVVIPPVSESHHHGNVDVHEESALPRREVARDNVDRPLKRCTKLPGKFDPKAIRNEAVAAALSLALRQESAVASLRSCVRAPQPIVQSPTCPLVEEPRAALLRFCIRRRSDQARREHVDKGTLLLCLRHEHAIDVVGRDAHAHEGGDHVIHRSRVTVEEEDAQLARFSRWKQIAVWLDKEGLRVAGADCREIGRSASTGGSRARWRRMAYQLAVRAELWHTD
jgi:hypothetical protein